MSDLLMIVTCATCGGDLDEIAAGRPSPSGAQIASVMRCSACSRRWVVHVTMLIADVDEDRGVALPPKGARVFTTCKVCGVSMPKYPRPGKGGKARVTCGPECAKANWSAQSRARAAERAS